MSALAAHGLLSHLAIIALILAGALAYASVCAWGAVQSARVKRYNEVTWGVLGFLFGLPAFLAIALVPARAAAPQAETGSLAGLERTPRWGSATVRAGMMPLSPIPGRDYSTAAEVRADWDANCAFHTASGNHICRDDLSSGQRVEITYAGHQKHLVVYS